LKHSLDVCKKLKLSYKENSFTFEFSALSYNNIVDNQYAYKLEGFDDNWEYVGTRRFASYTNIDAGNYVFKVVGSNNSGVWNEEGTSLSIIITPPWWQTRLAYFCYLILVLGIFTGFYRFRLGRVRLQHQVELEHVETEWDP